MTTALEGGEWAAVHPGHTLPPEKNWYPLYRRLVGPQGRSGQVRKISPPPGFDPWTAQPVVSRYTDWATQPTNYNIIPLFIHHYKNRILRYREGYAAMIMQLNTIPSLAQYVAVIKVKTRYMLWWLVGGVEVEVSLSALAVESIPSTSLPLTYFPRTHHNVTTSSCFPIT
jgi:hypothetical protein